MNTFKRISTRNLKANQWNPPMIQMHSIVDRGKVQCIGLWLRLPGGDEGAFALPKENLQDLLWGSPQLRQVPMVFKCLHLVPGFLHFPYSLQRPPWLETEVWMGLITLIRSLVYWLMVNRYLLRSICWAPTLYLEVVFKTMAQEWDIIFETVTIKATGRKLLQITMTRYMGANRSQASGLYQVLCWKQQPYSKRLMWISKRFFLFKLRESRFNQVFLMDITVRGLQVAGLAFQVSSPTSQSLVEVHMS